MTSENKDMTYVLFHANCPDGFGAATVAWMNFGDNATYIPVQYGEPLPEIADGSYVFIVDFSYDRETLIALKERSELLVVLDHHKTARDALEGLDFATFDLSKSGSVLAWEYFHPNGLAPLLIRYIQDRDLWQWKLPDSREVSAFLSIQDRNFTRWSELVNESMGFLKAPMAWVAMGKAVLASQRIQASSLCDHAVTANIGGFKVPSVNSPLLQSEIGEELCIRNPEASFAAVYFVLGGKEVVWSLRSRNGFDVSAVAKSFGGGGHPSAAGFKVPISELKGAFDVSPLA